MVKGSHKEFSCPLQNLLLLNQPAAETTLFGIEIETTTLIKSRKEEHCRDGARRRTSEMFRKSVGETKRPTMVKENSMKSPFAMRRSLPLPTAIISILALL